MTTVTVRGESSNLQVAEWELAKEPLLQGICKVVVKKIPRERSSLGHGILAEMTITIASGVATTAVTDAIRLVIARARARGEVEQSEVADEDAPQG